MRKSHLVKVCGIALSNDNKSAYQENIINKIVKLERQLDLWRMRNLTLQGKILIVKTFGLSQLIYSLQSTYIREEELKVIENVIFRFVWNIKKTNPIVSGKIKRDIIKKDIEEGGLRAPDIAHINSSIKYKNLLKHLYGSNHLLKVIYRNKVGNKFSLNNYNIGATSKTYVGTALNTHKLIGQLLHSDIKTISDETDGIHRNYFAYLQNNELINSPFTNINQQAMITRLIAYNIKTFGDVYKEKLARRYPNLYLDIHQIFNTYPIEWRTLITKTSRTHNVIADEIPFAVNKWQKIHNFKIKNVVTYLLTKYKHERYKDYLVRKHKISVIDAVEYNEINNPFEIIK